MRRALRLRYLLPVGVVIAVALGGILITMTAGASASRAGNGAQTTAALPAPSIHYIRKFTSAQVHEGEVLFEQTCSACHGPEAAGTALAPDLQGVGPATVDFWVSTGRMPLASTAAEASIKPARFNSKQTLDIAAFVASLAPTSPSYPDGVPVVDTKDANLALGARLFVLNCAACHTITGAGDALANGAYAPSLHIATTTQVAEAIRTGPGEMPVFGPGELSNKQVADIVAYVTGPIQHPQNLGGISLGGIGPVAEGLVALLVGVGALMLVAFWLGERA